MCLDQYRRWTVVGVTSFGPPACLLANHKDDVFTQTSSFKDWGTEIIGTIIIVSWLGKHTLITFCTCVHVVSFVEVLILPYHTHNHKLRALCQSFFLLFIFL